MADISMCGGKDCDRKESCFRFTARPDKNMQSYLIPDKPGKDCDMFWDNSKMTHETKEYHNFDTPESWAYFHYIVMPKILRELDKKDKK